MKKLALTMPALLAPLPALAHGGAHLHPHGSETAMILLSVALVAAIVAGLIWRR